MNNNSVNKHCQIKNFAFFYCDRGWLFAPAFDLVPNDGMNGYRTTSIGGSIKPTKSGLFAVAVRPDRIRRKQIGFSKIYGERRSDGTIFQDPLVRFQSSAFLRCVRCHVRDVQLHLLDLLARASPDVREVALQDPVGQQANLIFM